MSPSEYARDPATQPLLEPLSERTNSSKNTPLSSSLSHKELHKTNGDVIRDIIIGFADGLTVPFALCAGLSSLGNTRLVVMGGLAELFSGAISMGLGAYLAAVTERQHYESEEAREREEVAAKPEVEKQEIVDILSRYHISHATATAVAEELSHDEDMWVQFMMDFELCLERPRLHRAWISAFTMGAAYFIGGLIPMIPYFMMHSATDALFVSIGITVVILIAFGYVKTLVTVGNKKAGAWGAVQTLVIGVAAAAASYGIVRALDSSESAGAVSL